MIYGATDDNRLALPARDRTVTDRLAALGMEFLGPRYPAGRWACPTPQGLPHDTENVPTYYTSRQCPATAQNQLDYVFASRGFHESISVRALNSAGGVGRKRSLPAADQSRRINRIRRVSQLPFLKNLFKRNRRLKGPLETPDLIIVGLGNPEPQYLNTRHNAGWWLVDLLAERHRIDIKRAHSTTRIGIGKIDGHTVALAKPRTYVNRSGNAVTYLLTRFGADRDRLLVVYDEIALDARQAQAEAERQRGRAQRNEVDHRRARQPGLQAV